MTNPSQDSMVRAREALLGSDAICYRYEIGGNCMGYQEAYCPCRNEVKAVAAAIDAAVAAERETWRLRCELVLSPELYNAGDARIAWVNEGDSLRVKLEEATRTREGA